MTCINVGNLNPLDNPKTCQGGSCNLYPNFIIPDLINSLRFPNMIQEIKIRGDYKPRPTRLERVLYKEIVAVCSYMGYIAKTDTEWSKQYAVSENLIKGAISSLIRRKKIYLYYNNLGIRRICIYGNKE